MKKKYRSKIGFIKFIPLFFVLGYMGIEWLFRDVPGNWLFYGSLIMMTLIPTIFSIPIYYAINDSTLIIKYAFFAKIKIDIDKIVKIKETDSILSANTFALSLDRIEITYKKYDHITISPKNKHEFIKDLMSVNSGIEVVAATKRQSSAY